MNRNEEGQLNKKKVQPSINELMDELNVCRANMKQSLEKQQEMFSQNQVFDKNLDNTIRDFEKELQQLSLDLHIESSKGISYRKYGCYNGKSFRAELVAKVIK